MSVVTPPETDAVLDEVLGHYPAEPASLISVLQDVQGALNYLPREALERISSTLGVPRNQSYHVATFFKAFTLEPRGQHTIKVCMGTACHVRGAPRILEELSRQLEIGPGETSADGEFTLETVNCVGACALGPVVVVDEHCYKASPATVGKLIANAREGIVEGPSVVFPEDFGAKPCACSRLDSGTVSISVCGGTGCQAYGCEVVASAVEEALDTLGVRDRVAFYKTGCHGFCERGPIAVIRPEHVFYQHVRPEDVAEIVTKTVVGGEVIDRLLYRDPIEDKPVVKESEIPFYAGQQRLIFGDNGLISPDRIDDYLKRGGYEGLRKALTMEPEAVIDEVTRAGLRGRGGGGFLTGRKWTSCRKAHGEPKYVICNADEGDPGAYMDRSLLEGNPHRVLEGMIIGAHAIGSNEGYVYVRDEYPLAVKNINVAIEQARERGFLGENILDSGFRFDVRVVRGGGAFVCGESTALMTSLEGRAGEPRAKYIHTVDSGLWGKPSNLNNVETWANVPLIISQGAEQYAKVGTDGSKGTKIFSLVGKIVNTGLVEVPMGVTLRHIIFDIGGGIPGGRGFKAVQTGGPSGGCLPESLLDLEVDFDELTKAGSMMGSGGMIVLDEDSCMVDVAKYFLNFLMEESCGKCVPCREGVRRMHDILDRMTKGEGREGDIELLEELSEAVIDGSLCALGGSAPNPVLSTLRYFREEYEAHINEQRCPAGACKALILYVIDAEKCTGCRACAKKCPVDAITGELKGPHEIDFSKCIKCGICKDTCKFDSVIIDVQKDAGRIEKAVKVAVAEKKKALAAKPKAKPKAKAKPKRKPKAGK
ncbi:MAG: NADH-quinone oxidoreductase subunit F [Nitrospiraceae bacterium]|nr:NADH-quinone oxidoreductase subunit F [Nitrospiraceae bacterium]